MIPRNFQTILQFSTRFGTIHLVSTQLRDNLARKVASCAVNLNVYAIRVFN